MSSSAAPKFCYRDARAESPDSETEELPVWEREQEEPQQFVHGSNVAAPKPELNAAGFDNSHLGFLPAILHETPLDEVQVSLGNTPSHAWMNVFAHRLRGLNPCCTVPRKEFRFLFTTVSPSSVT